MVTLNIDKTSYSRDQLADYLRSVANMIEEGYVKGIDWELDGDEEVELETTNDEDHEPDDTETTSLL